MQLFVKDTRSIALTVDARCCTVLDLKALYTLKAYGREAPGSWALLHGGRQLDDDATLDSAGVEAGATLFAVGRLRGGGGDGGSTGAESRSCYLEMYLEKKPDKVDPLEALAARWTRCHLTGERLSQPVVADELGQLYNKEALVHALLRKALPPGLAHISGLKSVVTLQLTPTPARASGTNGTERPAASGLRAGAPREFGPGNDADFMCPITGLEMNGRSRFVVHRPSGHVLSERALKDAPMAVEELLGGCWQAGDLWLLNPTGEDADKVRSRVAARLLAERERKAAKEGKKASKRAAAAAISAAAAAAAEDGAGAGDGGNPPADVANGTAAKKLKVLPEGATATVYASLFHSAEDAAKVKETFTCRAVSSRGVRL